jgi:hypothetical protein
MIEVIANEAERQVAEAAEEALAERRGDVRELIRRWHSALKQKDCVSLGGCAHGRRQQLPTTSSDELDKSHSRSMLITAPNQVRTGFACQINGSD